MSEKLKILVVEDELPVAMMMVHLLTRVGCEVVTTHTGSKALEVALETKFDLIALDIDLPDMSGFDICQELKQRHVSRNTPVIFVSGRSYELEIQRSLEVGAVDFICKPFKAADFIDRVFSAVDTRLQMLAAF